MSNSHYTGLGNENREVTTTVAQDDKFGPIAVIGFAHKLPQDVTSADSLWKLLVERRTTVTEVPMNRWNIDGFYRSHGSRPSTVKNRGGHFLTDDPGRFDAPFFSITPAEAECMDPQQRFLLETSYHALENAGIPMEAAMGSKTSVHVGCLLQEYSQISQRDAMPGTYQIIGSSGLAMLANRVSWFYDLKGPSMTIDTACSGSLVALHLACQELNAGSVNMALACGSNLCLLPDSCSLLSQLNMMSPDGVCHSFDERANGYAKSEGFGVLVLKRFSQAVQDGDTIRAVIRATGCNSDGRTPSITSPSQKAQEKLIRETYHRGGLSLDETRFFEAHGTGTPVGDPCEATTISNVFAVRTKADPMYVGALKSNLGHSEGASGVAGVIKAILALEKGIIPPNVYPERVNPIISSTCRNLHFPLTSIDWPTMGVRRASVNAFGYGGTNAHVVIDDALSFFEAKGLKGRHNTTRLKSTLGQDLLLNGRTNRMSRHDSMTEDRICNTQLAKFAKSTYKLLVLSAFDESAVHRSIKTHSEWLRSQQSHSDSRVDVSDLAHTLSHNRTSFPWRSFCVTGSETFFDNVWSTPIRSKQRIDLCFVFTGQGAQWYGMGRELMKYSIFYESMIEADRVFSSLGSEWSMMEQLYHISRDDTFIDSPDLSQPICTALQIAMVELLRSWNVRPSTVLGHSSGEIAAAYANGAISKESAWMIAYMRGLAVVIIRDILQSTGAMVAVPATLEAISPLLKLHNRTYPADRVSIACYNSPSNLTISGSHAAVDQLISRLVERNITYKVLRVDVAYHSHHMRPVAIVYDKLLRSITPGQQHGVGSTFISTVTGKALEDASILRKPSYWIENLTAPVKFSPAMMKASSDFILEIGPHFTLKSPIRDILNVNGRDIRTDYCSVLQRGCSADFTAMECVGRLHALGLPVDISQVNLGVVSDAKMLTNLPSYPFSDKTKYWLEGRTSKQYRFREYLNHELLGTRSDDWNPHEARWTNRIILDQSSYLLDHQINGSVLLPAAGMLVMAIEAMRQLHTSRTSLRGYKMKDVTFSNTITITPESNGTEVQLTLRPSQVSKTPWTSAQHETSWNIFSIFMYESAGWTLCCSGAIAVEYTNEHGVLEEEYDRMKSHKTALRRCQVDVNSSDIYSAFEKAGLVYGPRFQAMEEVRELRGTEAIGNVNIHHWKLHDPDSPMDPHLIHPAALDAILQMSFPAYSIYAKNASATTLPTGFRSLWISENLANVCPNSKVSVHARVTGRGFRNKMFGITAALVDEEELSFSGDMETTTIGRGASTTDADGSGAKILYKIEAKPDVDLLPRNIIDLKPSLRPTPEKELEMALKKEALCRLIMRDALSKLPDDLGRLPEYLLEYIDWMRSQAVDHVILPHESIYSLCEQLETSDTEGRLLSWISKNLNSILACETNALDLLLEDDALSQFHPENCAEKHVLSYATNHLDLLAHKYPNMHVLEISAGTGSTTSHVLTALKDRFAEYVYTDTTSVLFEKANERFNLRSKMAFKVLDPCEDFAGQGFEDGSFDLVITPCDLFTTATFRDRLARYRRLLRPQGRIVLLNQPRKSLPERFILGLTGVYTEIGQVGCSSIGNNYLDQILVESSFSGIDFSVQTHAHEDEDALPQVVISTAVSFPSDSHPTIHVIYEDSSRAQMDILEEICNRSSSQDDETIIIAVPWSNVNKYNLKDRTCIFLPSLDARIQPLEHMEDDTLESLKQLISMTSTLIWISTNTRKPARSPTESLVPGLVRTLATETEDNRLVSLSLDIDIDISDHAAMAASASHTIMKVARTFLHPRAVYEDEYVEVDGVLHIPRVVDDRDMATHVAFIQQRDTRSATKPWKELKRPHLSIRTAGYLDTLYFEESTKDGNDDGNGNEKGETALASDEVLIQVKAVGLGVRDLLVALGQVHDDVFGTDIAGVVEQVSEPNDHGLRIGDCVFGVARDGVAQVVRTKAFQLRRMPLDMDWVEAATYPATYCTAYHGLVNCARIRKDDVVLVHRGVGRLGQAAVQIAQLYGCSVIVTVESSEEMAYMHGAYRIPSSHLLLTRSAGSAQSIRKLANERGVDVIFNPNTAAESTNDLWDTIAPFGRFVEVIRSDAFTSTVNASNPQHKQTAKNNCISISVDFQELMRHSVFAGILRDVGDIIDSGRLSHPSAVQVFHQGGVEAAFRALQDPENRSRVVIEMASEEIIQMELAPSTKSLFDPRSTYLIVGAFGGIGENVTRWMVQNGAKNLILPSRSVVEGTSSHRELFVHNLRAEGAIVQVPVCDIANRAQLERTLEELKDMPPVKGCVQAAMVLQDSSFANMTADKWNEVLAPKVAGSWNLHNLLPDDLDFFVMMSSSTGIMGSFGQSNYTAGNTYQDELAAHRVKHGQRAVALAFSMVVGAGYVEQNAAVQALLRVRGMLEEVTLDDIYNLMTLCCDPERMDAAHIGPQIITSLTLPADLRAMNIVAPLGSTRPLYSYLDTLPSRFDEAAQKDLKESKKLPSALLPDATTLDEAVAIITEAIQDQLSSLLVVSKDDIDIKNAVHKYGVDSLVAVEMKNWLAKAVGSDISTTEILGDVSIDVLAGRVATMSRFVSDELKG